MFFEFADAFAFSDFVVADDAFAHIVVVGVDEFPEDFLFVFVFFLELFVEDLDFCDFCGEL